MINDSVESKYIRKIVWLLIGVYVAVFGLVCFLKFNSYGYHDFDLAIYAQVLWNALHGSLYSSILNINILGNHFCPVIFFIVPLYALASHPLTLIIVQTLCLGLAAYPLYLICRQKLTCFLSLALVIAYLLYPGLGHTNLFEFHPTALATFFLMWMLYFFLRGQFWYFLLLMVLALACQENIPILVVMVGIYALIRRRGLKWILVPILSGGLWFYLAITKLIPFFGRGTVEFLGALYGHLGGSFGEIVKNIMLHPFAVLAYMFAPEKIIYLVQILGSAAFLSLLDPPSLLMLAPALAQHLLSRRTTEIQIIYHYTAEIIPFIFVSACFGARRLYQFITSPRIKGSGRAVEIGLALLIFLAAAGFNLYLGPQLTIIRQFTFFRKDYLDEIKAEFLRKIPKDAAVTATFEFLPALAQRSGLYSFHHIVIGAHTLSHKPYVLPAEVNYTLVDFNDHLTFNIFYRPEEGKRIREFLDSGNWGVDAVRGAVALFRKGKTDSFKLYETGGITLPEGKIISATVDEKFELLGFETEAEGKRATGIIPISFYCRRLQEEGGDYGILIFLADEKNTINGWIMLPLAYRVYPVCDWKPFEVVKINFLYPIPPRLPAGEYRLMLGVNDYEKKELCKISTPVPGITTPDGKFILVGIVDFE